jgi:hypothetical protein
MKFNIDQSISVLERTPGVIKALLQGLDDEWVLHNEGGETWSPYVVTGHLVHAEKTDWLPRVRTIVLQQDDQKFPPFDRNGQFEDSKGKSLDDLIAEFATLRKQSIGQLRVLVPDETQLDAKGIHAEFGEVTLRQLLSTWVVHDLAHLSQITRVMAKQYKEEIGPWVAYI